VVAVGEAHVIHDNPVAGVHVYVAAPVAVNAVDAPVHIATLEPALTVGKGLTDTETVAVFVQPVAPVPVTVYIVDMTGLAVGVVHVLQESDAAGDHE
jgi:hypothetical protein